MSQSNQPIYPQIQQNTIVQAFSIIINPQSKPQQITKVNQYFQQCQKNPDFPIALLRIFGAINNDQIQLQSLLLFTNVLKRNWTKKRNMSQGASLENKKQIIKKGVLQVYVLKTPKHTKNLNQTIKYLARQDYPENFIGLQEFIINQLKKLEKQNKIITMLSGNQASTVIGILSTIKKIIKQYTHKRIYHEKESFSKYIVQVIKALVGIQNLVYSYLENILKNQSNVSLKTLQNVLQAQKKIDKIMLYSLLCAPTQLQSQKQLTDIITRSFSKLKTFDQLLIQLPKLRQFIQKNITAIIENNAKIQSQYPFLFTNFLQGYLNFIVSLVMNPKKFKSDDLHCALITALTKPFQTFAYYMPEQEFKQSLVYRKNAAAFGQQQKKCQEQFSTVFQPQVLNGMFQKILTQLINYFPDKNQENQLVFQDVEGSALDTTNQSTPNELLMILLKHMLRCFKNQSKPMIEQIFKTLVNAQGDLSKNPLCANFIELVLIMPKVYDSVDLPMNYILLLLKKLLDHNELMFFARIVKNYDGHMQTTAIRQCFLALTKNVSQNTNMDPKSLYQCAITIKKMMKEHDQEQIPLDNVAGCLRRIIQLLKYFTNNPVLLWPLVHLTNQLTNSLNEQILIQIFPQIIHHLDPLLKIVNGTQLLVSGLSQLLQNMLGLITPQLNSLMKCLAFVQINLQNRNLQTYTHLYKLWLMIIKLVSVDTQNNQTSQFMYKLFEKNQKQLFQEDIQIYIELIQEYMLAGILPLNQDQLLQVYTKVYQDKQQQIKTNSGTKARILIPLYSFYFSYSIKNNTCSKNWIKLIIRQVKNLYLQISPHINALRTLLLIIFHQHICRFGVQNIYGVISQQWSDYKQWFSSYYWSMEYVSNKYAYKINSAGILLSLNFLIQHQMLQTQIDNNLPLDTIFKVLVIQLEPVKLSGIHSYSNIFKILNKADTIGSNSYKNEAKSRKIRLQYLNNISQKDLTPVFKDIVTKIFREWDWGMDDVQQRFHKNVAEKIIQILNGNPQYKIQNQNDKM